MAALNEVKISFNTVVISVYVFMVHITQQISN